LGGSDLNGLGVLSLNVMTMMGILHEHRRG
jgi:hypothetical protein